MRYLIRWVVCLICVIHCMGRGLSASEWTCVGYEKLNGMVDSIIENTPGKVDEVKSDYLNNGNNSIKLESANPFLLLTSEDISIEGYLAAVQEGDESLIHDILLRLLVKYNTMIDSNEKAELRVFLESVAQDLVESANQNFQRDYIVLWQAYVFYMKLVPSVNDSYFISYSQKAYNLADAHEDEKRTLFVMSLFLDRMTSNVGKFIAKKIITSELKRAIDPRFLERVICFWDHRSNLAPPPYDETVRRNLVVYQSPPPPYSALNNMQL